jgi:hypothetical protein
MTRPNLRLKPLLLAIVLTASVFTSALSISVPAPKASALSGSEFRAGRIMDDFVFFRNQATMSVSEIQAFLNAKVPVCDTWGTQPYGGGTRASFAASRGVSTPFTCLKDYRENTPGGKPVESGLCFGWGGGNMSAAEIIYHVSSSCGVNTKVLITLLQKEQSLITDDWPWPVQYRSATGYGCPDTAACDAEYYGFFNQVYSAARQFKRYARDSSNYNYEAGRNNFILYNPQASCGGSTVFIETRATAGLYNYTPYQPNPSALANLYGTGDACGAYGNRNFWRMWRDWFGTTYANDTDIAHPNGTLIHDHNGIYLIENNQRRFFAYPEIINSYRYNWDRIKRATTGDMALPAGPNVDTLAPGTVFRVNGSPVVYVMDYDTGDVLKKRAITDTVFRELGYTNNDVMNVPAYVVAQTPSFSSDLTVPRHPSGTIVLFYGIPVVYLVDKGTLRPFQNELALSSNNYKMRLLKGGTQYDSWQPTGTNVQPRGGTMVRTAHGIALVDYDGQGPITRPVGPWDCYADRMHYTTRDWVVGYESLQVPARTGPTFSC